MNLRKNPSEKHTASASRRFAVGAASVLTATALVGVGAQGAFAASPNATPSGSGSASATSSAHGLLSLETLTSDLGNGVFSGHLNGAKAQALAKKLVGDSALFSLLPSTMQGDVTTLANATVKQRAADAKKIVSTALAGGYGATIRSLASQLRDAHGLASVNSIVGDVVRDLKDGTGIGAEGAKIATTVIGDKQLLSSLPMALQADLMALTKAPASQQSADVQKIIATALFGGYGTTIQTIADQLQSGIVSGQ